MNMVKNLVIENKNLIVIITCVIIAIIIAVILYKKSSKYNKKYYEEEEEDMHFIEQSGNVSSDVSSDKLEYKKNLKISGTQSNVINNNGTSSESNISVIITDKSEENSSNESQAEFVNPIIPNGTPAPISYGTKTTIKTELPTQIGTFSTTGELQKS